MNKKILLFVLIVGMSVSAKAQDGFGLMFGLNTTSSSTEHVGWSAGGFVGGSYDIQLSGPLYLQPRLQLYYEKNQYEGSLWSIEDPYYGSFGVMLPVLASFKIDVSKLGSLRLNAGPYLQYDIFGMYQGRNWWHASMKEKINYGIQAGLQLDFDDMFITGDFRHSLHRSILNFGGFENAFQVGLGFRF